MKTTPKSGAAGAPPNVRVQAVRRFNRFYTGQIGVLTDGLLESPFSLAEVRVLYELAHRQNPLASSIAHDLGLDAGYLSRILRDFVARRLVERRRSACDGRQSPLSLTALGRKTFLALDRRANEQVRKMLGRLPASGQARLVTAMDTVEALLDSPRGEKPHAAAYSLRAHRPGDMGWVVHRHGALYWQEYGYNEEFEALVARIVGEFIPHFDPACEHCWIAEREGERVGSVFLVKKSKSVAKLRLLLVEPSARGMGIGRRLVEECMHFARRAGYNKITLWTQSHLDAARRIYKNAGFQLMHTEAHHSFGMDLVAETWDLYLESAVDAAARLAHGSAASANTAGKHSRT